MRIFAGAWVRKFLETIGWKEGEAIESRTVSRRIEAAQKKIEERNFEIRKHLLEYDEVMDEQRKRIYGYRQRILDGADCRELIVAMIRGQVERAMDSYLSPMFGPESFAVYASGELFTQLEPKLFRGADFESAVSIARDEAERAAETDILSEMDQHLPEGDEEEWNWRPMVEFVNRRWKLGLTEAGLKKVGRDELAEYLIGKAREAIQTIDLEAGRPLLDEEVGLKSALRWNEAKFGVALSLESLQGKDAAFIKRKILEEALASYDRKEADYPVMAGMYRFSKREGKLLKLDGNAFTEWANRRFRADLTPESMQTLEGEAIHDRLLEFSKRNQVEAIQARKDLEKLLGELERAGAVPYVEGDARFASLRSWLEGFGYRWDDERLVGLERNDLREQLIGGLADHFHPEMRRLERFVLLEIVDSAWKDHLLAMDYLRSAVGQRGMAQLDPKVEYKREGMRMFEDLWKSIEERTIELIFRMEQLDEGFVSSTWVETAARHDTVRPVSEIARQQEQAIAASQQAADAKVEPIRNRIPKVGRNDPCPCGSGKKYKQCCMRKEHDAV